ncbi:MAG: acyltransferase [Planctomycetota bacterium]|nr:MAG: acyltransferase [Planctomycetota bacterium]
MTFNPCIVIPDYNHKEKISGMMEELSAAALPCAIINDGSNEETKKVLMALEEKYSWLVVLHHEKNKGKGVSMETGFNWAQENSYSHVLQIDADGQHDCGDVKKFLGISKENPSSIVLGRPNFDESVPMGRYLGRYITHFWVWVETLSFKIKDSMCGFRVYPVQAVFRLFQKSHVGKRMDFDTEILVHLFWLGLPLKTLDTKVKYHQDEISNFRIWEDNLSITWMHTKLVCGMLLRFPVLIYRKWKPYEIDLEEEHWSKVQERGSYGGIYITVLLYKFFGKNIARIIMAPVIFYFFLSGTVARNASKKYFKCLADYSPEFKNLKKPLIGDVLNHFFSFGNSGLDKFSAWLGYIKKEYLNWPNREVLVRMAEEKKGAVLVGAHLGNIEVIRALINEHKTVIINALVYIEHAEKLNSVLKKINPDVVVEIIAINEMNMATAMLMNQKIENGEFIAILADRLTDVSPDKRQAVSFLGQEAYFPTGPFILGSILKCPIYSIFCMKEHEKKYNVYLEKLSDQLVLPRKNREEALKEIVEIYVERIEKLCVKYPYQWYTFYPFWR